MINEAFLAPMKDFNPLPQNKLQLNVDEGTLDFQVSEFQIFKSLSTLDSSKFMGPDGISSWVLKENADILTQPT